jgi:hypothetical protein
MWSLENEFYGQRSAAPSVQKELGKLGRIVKAADPTRPITFESDGDPDHVTDVMGMHYPNEYPDKRNWPNDAYWLGHPREPIGVGGYWPSSKFLWNHAKPLYIGEYLWVPTRSPGENACLYGDDAYRDYTTYRTLAKALAWRMQILAYRYYEVSGHSP